MARPSKHQEMRRKLKKAAIRIAAREGLENITTKKIARAASLAEVYIYRYFDGKDDLLQSCFLDIDMQIGETVCQACVETQKNGDTMYTAIQYIWMKYWDFLLRHPENTLYYFRYYLSANYTDDATQQRRKNYENLVTKALSETRRTIFSDLDMLWGLLDHVTDNTLICAVRMIRDKVIRERSKPTQAEVELIYRLVVIPAIHVVNEVLIESEKNHDG